MPARWRRIRRKRRKTEGTSEGRRRRRGTGRRGEGIRTTKKAHKSLVVLEREKEEKSISKFPDEGIVAGSVTFFPDLTQSN